MAPSVPQVLVCAGQASGESLLVPAAQASGLEGTFSRLIQLLERPEVPRFCRTYKHVAGAGPHIDQTLHLPTDFSNERRTGVGMKNEGK